MTKMSNAAITKEKDDKWKKLKTHKTKTKYHTGSTDTGSGPIRAWELFCVSIFVLIIILCSNILLLYFYQTAAKLDGHKTFSTKTRIFDLLYVFMMSDAWCLLTPVGNRRDADSILCMML